jgi:hypothetical protein
MMSLWAYYNKKYDTKYFFAFLNSIKKGVGSGVGSGSGSISQRCGIKYIIADPEIRTKMPRIPNTANDNEYRNLLHGVEVVSPDVPVDGRGLHSRAEHNAISSFLHSYVTKYKNQSVN